MDLVIAIYRGAISRVRPIVMTIAPDMLGLLPIMWSTGAGAEVMKRLATPLFAGILTLRCGFRPELCAVCATNLQ